MRIKDTPTRAALRQQVAKVVEKVRYRAFISYCQYILQITQPSQYRCTQQQQQLQYRFLVTSEYEKKIILGNMLYCVST